MQRKQSNSQATKRFLQAASEIKFWSPVVRNGWLIKFSVNDNENVLITFISVYTNATVIRYFSDEDDAVKFINYMTNQDPYLYPNQDPA